MRIKKLIAYVKNQFEYGKNKKKAEIRDIAFLIGSYFAFKLKTKREILVTVGITDIDVNKDKIIITCKRPGILIGRKAETIEGLMAFLKSKLNDKISLRIQETKPLCFEWELFSAFDNYVGDDIY